MEARKGKEIGELSVKSETQKRGYFCSERKRFFSVGGLEKGEWTVSEFDWGTRGKGCKKKK